LSDLASDRLGSHLAATNELAPVLKLRASEYEFSQVPRRHNPENLQPAREPIE
jgi:hypothetical protein